MALGSQFRWQYVAHCLIDDLMYDSSMVLPGMRALGKRYKVSLFTIGRALLYLEEQDILSPAQQGRKRQVNLSKLHRIASLKSREASRVLFITSQKRPAYITRSIYEAIRRVCEINNFFLSYVEAPASPTGMKDLLTALQPQGLILHLASHETAKAVASLGILIVGIMSNYRSFPCFSNGLFSSLLLQSFQRAWEAGHRRISSPSWNVKESLHEDVAMKLEKYSNEKELPFSRSYNLPSFRGETPEDYFAALHELFRYTPPSCLILYDLRHYLVASSFFLEKGLHIPRDISVIILSENPLQEDIVPSLAHFTLFSNEMITQAFHALQEQMNGLQTRKQQICFVPDWVPGNSLAAPRS